MGSLAFLPPTTVSCSPRRRHLLVRQVTAAILQRRPLPPPSPRFPGWTSDAVRDVLSSISACYFLSPRSVGRQRPSGRHLSPLRQRSLRRETSSARGPAAHRDPDTVALGVAGALEFYSWAESVCGFPHDELTCRDMSRLLARANCLPILWRFLRANETLVGTATVTEVIKVLGEEGLTKEALAAFYRMKQLHCKPDVRCYNTVISALCRVGHFKKARFLLDQMELPGARCPPDTFTYTILISSYCKHSLQTGCRKAIRRRIWEANHMYYSVVNQVDKAVETMRAMVSRNHGKPTSSSYTPIIHALCETGRVREARDFLEEMAAGGSMPREFTYNLSKYEECVSYDGAQSEGNYAFMHLLFLGETFWLKQFGEIQDVISMAQNHSTITWFLHQSKVETIWRNPGYDFYGSKSLYKILVSSPKLKQFGEI
ncbi:hypothetical protein OPV22_008910 [Ensete ventricosum]|uniref:Pentacotripeptide-repeat region of PRORP domain-containing protein n=1 Tax=Ensete ventricosum TaxID=4639 RepID=A0AAV8RHL6_ENSVE|nr:hypothetical protein OPV22_008910 [Ensete ventricosum]